MFSYILSGTSHTQIQFTIYAYIGILNEWLVRKVCPKYWAVLEYFCGTVLKRLCMNWIILWQFSSFLCSSNCNEEDAGCTGHEQQRATTKTALQSSFTSQQGNTVRHVIAHNSGAIPSCYGSFYESLKEKVTMETAEWVQHSRTFCAWFNIIYTTLPCLSCVW